ncbi:MAG: DUF402 domain-containing protein [Halobacteriaceae archaeon]
MDVGVRGIYATALTARFADRFSVVTPSATIRARFDRAFPTREPAVAVTTTRDRQGVQVTGDPDGVASVTAAVSEVAIDAFPIEAGVPPGTVVDAVVESTRGGGAVLDLGDARGYLPFDAVDDYVERGDVVRVQVETGRAPWDDHHPRVATTIAVQGTLVSLERGVDALVAGTPPSAEDLARTTELLDVDLPDGWGVRWEAPAIDASLATLEAALGTVTDRARRVEAALDAVTDGDMAPRTVVAPAAVRWVRLGRASRFALDEDRRTVHTTLPGHHRMKAAGASVSAAVDFAERLDPAVSAFPFAAVTEQFGPTTGDDVRIVHGKPGGEAYDLGQGTVAEWDPGDHRIELERALSGGGTYDALDVEKRDGDVAVTTVREGRWWYPTTYRSSDGALRGTYVNVNSPLEVFPDAVRYVDLFVDVVKWPDGEVAVVDTDELEAAVQDGVVPEPAADRAIEVANSVAAALRSA